MSFIDFKEVDVNNPGTSSFYGSDDLSEIMKILNGKIVVNRRPKILNPWLWKSSYDVEKIAVNPTNPPANTKRFYVDASDGHFKMLSSSGSVIDIDVLGQSAVGEANTVSNIGTQGEGLFKQKVGLDLQFRNIDNASNKVSAITNNTTNTVDIDVVEANLSHANIGGITTVPKGGTGLSSLTSQSLLKGNGTGNVNLIAPGTDGHILTMVSGAPAWASAGASADTKTAVFVAGSQIGSVGRRLNFTNNADFTIAENSGSDRFDITYNRTFYLVGAWQTSVLKTNLGTTYVDAYTSDGDGVGTNVDGVARTNFRLYVSWSKNGGLSTHSLRIQDQTQAQTLAEITDLSSGINTFDGTIPAFFKDQGRWIKVQVKAGNSTDDPILRAVFLYYK